MTKKAQLNSHQRSILSYILQNFTNNTKLIYPCCITYT